MEPRKGCALAASGLPEGSFPLAYFRRALSKGRLSHAYLFAGPEGSGRRPFAREVAKAIFCRQGEPCGSCASCLAIDHGNHPGLHIYGPGEGKSSIEIADVREIEEKIHLRRIDFLVAILEDADRLTVPAANALLKTLEEPTGEAVLILIARSAGGLLPTIVSRCHRIPFPDPGPTSQRLAPGARAAGGGELSEEDTSRPAGGGRPPPEGAAPGEGPSLDDLYRADFHAVQDAREWLGSLFPEARALREAVRLFLAAAFERERARWSPPPCGSVPDPGADRLEKILELRADLDRNVNPDLVLEAALSFFRKFP